MGFSASGQRQFQNNVFVDGATNAMQFYGTQAESYPQDWVQEFQVMTNGFSAEFGQASGAVLNVITKSGTNRLQGRGYGFVRDDNFDTAPYAGRFVNGEPEFLTSRRSSTSTRSAAFSAVRSRRTGCSSSSATRTSRTTQRPSSPSPTTGAIGACRR